MRRLRDGEAVVASDGRGSWRPCRIVSIGRRRAGGTGSLGLEAAGPVRSEPAPRPGITVAFSPVKGDRTGWGAAKLTELGADRIIPLVCERTVVAPGRATLSPSGAGRLHRVVREAGMQARRVLLPELCPPMPIEELLAAADPAATCLAEPGGGPVSLRRPVVLVGPEGGWSDAELAAARSRGIGTVGLGPHVLRTETAAVAGAALLAALRAGRVAP